MNKIDNLTIITKNDECFSDLDWVLRARKISGFRFYPYLIVEYSKIWCTDGVRLHVANRPKEFDSLHIGLYKIIKLNKSEIIFSYYDNECIKVPRWNQAIPKEMKHIYTSNGHGTDVSLYKIYQLADICVDSIWFREIMEGLYFDVYYYDSLRPLLFVNETKTALLMPIRTTL